MGPLQLCGGPEIVAVDAQGLVQLRRGEVRGKGIGQAKLCRHRGAEGAGPEYPQRDVRTRGRHRLYRLMRSAVCKIGAQFHDVFGKGVGRGRRSPQGTQRGLVGPRRPAEPEIDAPRVELGECAKLLGDHQRGMIRQHDAARAHANVPGGLRHVADQQRGRRAGDPGHVVVFGIPHPLVAVGLGMLCDVPGTPDGHRCIVTARDADKVENR
ncbi:MAG: hypothetical protein RIC38_12040 [Chromatocurvus sp.]